VNEWSIVHEALLERGHRVLAYDQRGHGRSTTGPYSYRALFEDLSAVVENYDLQDLTIVGHSMGTYAAIGALADPALRARTRRAVLVSPQTGNSLHGRHPAWLLGTLTRSPLIPLLCRRRPIATRVIDRIVGPDASTATREATRRLFATLPKSTTELLRIMQHESVAATLPDLDLPITVLLGSDDHLTPEWHAKLITQRAHDATLTRLPRIGHIVNWEAPHAITNAVSATSRR